VHAVGEAEFPTTAPGRCRCFPAALSSATSPAFVDHIDVVAAKPAQQIRAAAAVEHVCQRVANQAIAGSTAAQTLDIPDRVLDDAADPNDRVATASSATTTPAILSE
jgi:uncharacterized phage protein gp47/JayE